MIDPPAVLPEAGMPKARATMALWAVAPTLRKPARGGAAAQDAAGRKTAESEHDDKKEINKE